MVLKILQLRISETDIRFADLLVGAGICKTRSDAFRYLIDIGVSKSSELPEIFAKVQELKELEKRTGMIPIDLKGAVSTLLNERDRFQ